MTEDRLIESPSGYTFRESQENGDLVDCALCGDYANDDYPLVNDCLGYLYHLSCYEDEYGISKDNGLDAHHEPRD